MPSLTDVTAVRMTIIKSDCIDEFNVYSGVNMAAIDVPCSNEKGKYCVSSSNTCYLQPPTTCAITNGFTPNTGVDCKCGAATCTSSTGMYCAASRSASFTIISRDASYAGSRNPIYIQVSTDGTNWFAPDKKDEHEIGFPHFASATKVFASQFSLLILRNTETTKDYALAANVAYVRFINNGDRVLLVEYFKYNDIVLQDVDTRISSYYVGWNGNKDSQRSTINDLPAREFSLLSCSPVAKPEKIDLRVDGSNLQVTINPPISSTVVTGYKLTWNVNGELFQFPTFDSASTGVGISEDYNRYKKYTGWCINSANQKNTNRCSTTTTTATTDSKCRSMCSSAPSCSGYSIDKRSTLFGGYPGYCSLSISDSTPIAGCTIASKTEWTWDRATTGDGINTDGNTCFIKATDKIINHVDVSTGQPTRSSATRQHATETTPSSKAVDGKFSIS